MRHTPWKRAATNRPSIIGFASLELLWQVLTVKRWQPLKVLCGAGRVLIREAARRVDRDGKAVHSAVVALLKAGPLTRSAGGGIAFPYEAVEGSAY